MGLGDYRDSAHPCYKERFPRWTCGCYCDRLLVARVPGGLYGQARRVAWAESRCENVRLSHQDFSPERYHCSPPVGPYWIGLVSGDGQVEVITYETDCEERIRAYVCDSDVWTYCDSTVCGCGVEDVVSYSDRVQPLISPDDMDDVVAGHFQPGEEVPVRAAVVVDHGRLTPSRAPINRRYQVDVSGVHAVLCLSGSVGDVDCPV